ncbi:hypothetical protein TrispH2_002109 [Trichoplax sp. H2]|nr:hypothetical protein TrispH2_002109 [Trichoplax sp. H2]|eukprot:RDD45759.1 hypothetical protein TrispH2_002109 [Trichoplax sp. H2]
MKSKALRIFSTVKLMQNPKGVFIVTLIHPLIILLNFISNIAIIINSSINLSAMVMIQNISRAGLIITEQTDDCTAVNACCNYEDQFTSILNSYSASYAFVWIFFFISCFLNILNFYRRKLYQQFSEQIKRDRNFDRASLISLLQPILLDGVPMTCIAIAMFNLESKPVYNDCLLCYLDQETSIKCTNQLLSSSDGSLFSFRVVITTISAIACSIFVTTLILINEKQIAAIYFKAIRKNIRFFLFPLVILAFGIAYSIFGLILYPASIVASILPLRYLDEVNRFFSVMGISALIAIPLMLIVFAVMVSIEFPHSKIFHQMAAVQLFLDLCAAFFIPHIYSMASILFQVKVYRRYAYPITTKKPNLNKKPDSKEFAEEAL